MNWVHVDNLVMAHLLAAEGLTPEKGCVAVSAAAVDTVCVVLVAAQ